MSDTYSFSGVGFLLTTPDSGETPSVQPALDVTDRRLIGTDRFERNIRSRQYQLAGDLYLAEASDWQDLQAAYAAGTLATLVFPNASSASAVILEWNVTPRRGGKFGYQGKVTFGFPGGAP